MKSILDHINPDHCPICNELAFSRCKCPLSDSVCSKGHKWHTCLVHNVIVLGNVDHSLPTYICTCSPPTIEKSHV